MLDRTKKKHRSLFLLGFIFLFLLLYSRSTSPLYCAMGEDSCIFIIIGRELLHGKIPYVDLYENKGPFLYFIQALPQLFWESRYSIFLLQMLLWFLQFQIIDCLSVFFHRTKCPAFVFLLFFLFALFNYEEGNLAEEYNLFFTFATAFFFLKILDGTRPVIPGIFMGISLAAVMLIRINDIVPICVFILCAFLFLFSKERPFVTSLIYLLSGIAGIGLVVVPTILYYYGNGCLEDMLQGYLFVNTQYIEGPDSSFLSARLSLLASPFGILCIALLLCSLWAAYRYSRRQDTVFAVKALLWLLPCLSVPALFVSKSGFLHYTFVLEILVVLSALILHHDLMPAIRRFLSGRRVSPSLQALAAILLFCLFCLVNVAMRGIITAPFTANNLLVPKESQYLETVHSLTAQIPDDERDSLYVINGFSANFYMETNTLPAYRYFLPLVYAAISPDIEKELIQYFESTPPQWIIVSDWSQVEAMSKEIYLVLQKLYAPIPAQTNRVMLYERK